MTTRRHLIIAAAAVSLGGLAAPALAQTWPARPITFIVPFPAGGGTDAFARPLAAQLDQQLGQRIVIENRGGAGGTVGASAAAKAAPDGYTFFVGAAHHAIAPALYPRLDYDIQKDFIPIAVIAQPPQVIVVHPGKVQAKTVAELVDYARKNPEKLNYASAGNGTTHHLAGELFQISTRTRLTHVPYRGAGPALQDTVAGQVDLLFDGLGSSAAQIQSGALRALAVAAPSRSEAVPDVPTAKEAGLEGFEVSTWYALWVPKGTPPEIVTRMRDEVQKALKTPTIEAAWKKNGSPMPTLAGDDFGKFITAEVERWGKVVKEAQVKLE
ncbi:Bug family tripartite tricarboxylate transporter substrate binding protein [Bosea minatitlanensis]|uniref:Bug family tripartite tricarboxylate transporter substrate binding protein n=1 Tax=Bosea minatitlanensis TaxID=128782 RepID=A0ABW0F4P4_9HYPH|nr:tripartite tricarboxylate transporter substrate binding protein [Bosea minatitlanensis]MCT4493701.1 tripartite tricarboxylate transporter substrate binding protein [Bosea minatitlanensis]